MEGEGTQISALVRSLAQTCLALPVPSSPPAQLRKSSEAPGMSSRAQPGGASVPTHYDFMQVTEGRWLSRGPRSPALCSVQDR